MAKTSDKPGFRTSLKALSQKAAERRKDPFVLELDGPENKITFPDPMKLSPLEAEEMQLELTSPSVSMSKALRRWLATEEDKEKWDKALLDGTVDDYATLSEISIAVVDYYQQFFGLPGEGPASQG